MNKRDFPKIHFYDQDFVDIYDKTWTWLSGFWLNSKLAEDPTDGYFVYPQDNDENPVLTSTTEPKSPSSTVSPFFIFSAMISAASFTIFSSDSFN